MVKSLAIDCAQVLCHPVRPGDKIAEVGRDPVVTGSGVIAFIYFIRAAQITNRVLKFFDEYWLVSRQPGLVAIAALVEVVLGLNVVN
jgi:hypothetical protein